MGVLGIDPGATGGLALLDQGGLLIEPMPQVESVLDLPHLKEFLVLHRERIEMAFMEKVSANPVNGSIALFKLGDNFGSLKAALSFLGIPYQLVTPQSWQKMMHAGIEGTDPKARSLIAVSRLFPRTDFRATERSKKAHLGMVEAALIAAYGARVLNR